MSSYVVVLAFCMWVQAFFLQVVTLPQFNPTHQIRKSEALRPSETVLQCEHHSHAYDQITKKCYSTHHSVNFKPCGPQMRFVRMEGNPIYGHCACDSEATSCDAPLVFSPRENRCYSMFNEGPCGENKWVVSSDNGTLACGPNPCVGQTLEKRQARQDSAEAYKANKQFFFGHNGKCYTTETQAFCKPNEIVRFVDGRTSPSCHTADDDGARCFWNAALADFDSSPPVGCLKGYKLSGNEDCIGLTEEQKLAKAHNELKW